MPSRPTNIGRKGALRPRRTPPHVPLRALRVVAGLTLDDLATQIQEVLHGEKPPTRGTLCAIESGARGASPDILEAIELVYGLDHGTISTTYTPRAARGVREAS